MIATPRHDVNPCRLPRIDPAADPQEQSKQLERMRRAVHRAIAADLTWTGRPAENPRSPNVVAWRTISNRLGILEIVPVHFPSDLDQSAPVVLRLAINQRGEYLARATTRRLGFVVEPDPWTVPDDPESSLELSFLDDELDDVISWVPSWISDVERGWGGPHPLIPLEHEWRSDGYCWSARAVRVSDAYERRTRGRLDRTTQRRLVRA